MENENSENKSIVEEAIQETVREALHEDAKLFYDPQTESEYVEAFISGFKFAVAGADVEDVLEEWEQAQKAYEIARAKRRGALRTLRRNGKASTYALEKKGGLAGATVRRDLEGLLP